METIHIPCPKCGSELKLRDRNLLGRKGKCPKCQHTFVLEEPAEVQLELAEADPEQLAQTAQWVPESSAPKVKTPRAASRPQAPQVAAISAIPDLQSFVESDAGAASRLKAMQKKNANRRIMGIAIGAVAALVVGGIGIYAAIFAPPEPKREKVEIVQEHNPVDAKEVAEPVAFEFERRESPTKGNPIDLQFIPYGTQIVLNVRPAELWKNDGPGKEFRYCIPPLAKLLEDKLMELFKRKPEQIEEAQICIIPGTLGTAPDIAAVIHLVEETKKSQLLEDFGGQQVTEFGHPVYISNNWAYLIADLKTIAVCPKAAAEEMVKAVHGRSLTSDGIDELLPMTDRSRHLTCIFVPRTIRQHASWWFPENLKLFVMNFCNWFGDEIESVSWSLHLGEKQFYSDMHLRNVTGVTSPRLEREIRGKLDKLPTELLTTIRMMNPREAGKRKIIGRVPKMSEVCSMASVTSHGPRHVQIITPLPERAAPNLALGTLLAWDESTRTNFVKEKPATAPGATDQKVPDLLVDRLKMKIDVEFSRTPLQDAYLFIKGEIKTDIEIDGDALKAGGFTKNMPQTFKMDKAMAQDVIAKLLEKYQDPKKPSQSMVLVVDEAKKKLIITTQAFAEQKNQTVFDIPKK